MVRRAVVLSLATAVVLALPGLAVGAPAQRVEYPIDESFVDEYLTDLCGTAVTVSSTGALHVTLWRNADGLIVRELDRYPNTWRTFTAENGSSFRIRFHAVQRLIYDGGARGGSLVRIETTGMFAHYPGIAFAGHATEVAVVQGFQGNGVPIIDFDTLIMQRLVGHNPDVDAAPAICEALSG